jgi:hypothetical protein
MTRVVEAPPPKLDRVTRRLLLLPAAVLANDHGELIGNDGQPPPSMRRPSLLPGAADSIGSERLVSRAFQVLTSHN